MKSAWIIAALTLSACRREVVKEQHAVTEAAESEVSQVKIDVLTARHVTEEPGKITEEEEVQIFDPPLHGDLKPIIRGIRRKKTITETGAKQDDLRVAWHGVSDEAVRIDSKIVTAAKEHNVTEPEMGLGWIAWTVTALVIGLIAFVVWRLWPKR